jgi:hypothetical protein
MKHSNESIRELIKKANAANWSSINRNINVSTNYYHKRGLII